MFSAFIKEKLYLGEAPIATIFGIILGPHVSGLIDPYKWGGEHDEVRDEITLELTRVVIAISVFAAGVELPKVRYCLLIGLSLRRTGLMAGGRRWCQHANRLVSQLPSKRRAAFARKDASW